MGEKCGAKIVKEKERDGRMKEMELRRRLLREERDCLIMLREKKKE